MNLIVLMNVILIICALSALLQTYPVEGYPKPQYKFDLLSLIEPRTTKSPPTTRRSAHNKGEKIASTFITTPTSLPTTKQSTTSTKKPTTTSTTKLTTRTTQKPTTRLTTTSTSRSPIESSKECCEVYVDPPSFFIPPCRICAKKKEIPKDNPNHGKPPLYLRKPFRGYLDLSRA